MAASALMSVLALALLAAAAPDVDAELRALQEAARDGHVAYEVVASLTTEVGPRLAGSPAEARARAWALEQLRGLGFENVRVEPATVRGWRRGEERARVISPYPQPLAVTALGLSEPTPKEGLDAEVRRFETLTELEAAPDDALEGKVAFIDQAMPKTQDGSGYGAVVEIRSRGPSVAADKGAVAVLIRSVGTDSHRFPHTGMLRYADDAPRIPAAALAAPDAEQLTRILAKGEPVKVHLELTPRFVGERPTGNVIAEIPGRSHPEEIVLLGAHLDSWDLGTGAVDDGAGVGIVVGAAKLLLEHAPRRPARTIRVVLFGAEEVGLVGAKAYAERHADALEKHVVAMESDFGAGRIYSLSAEVGEEAWPRVEALRARHLARLRVIPGQQGRAGGPDLWPMKQLGVPVIGLDQDGRDYFDLHHTADDTLDKIDPDTLWQNVAAYATVAWWASETGPRLRAPAAAMEVSDARPRPAVKVESDQDESAPQK